MSCGGDAKNKDKAIARVYDEYLMPAEVQGIVPPGLTGEDSIQVIRDYIDNWIRTRLLIKQSESNLNSEQKDFTRQLEDYRNSLIIYTYEQQLIRQSLDTTVTEQEIVKYYNENQADFELKDNIVKVWYVKLMKNAPMANFRQLLQSEKPGDKKKLTDLCAKQAVNSYLDDQTWLLFDDILKEIPIKTYNQEEYLKNNRFIEIQDSLFTYMLNIKGFMIKESLSPLSFETENIRSIIINKRKLALIDGMKKNIYNDAVKNGDFEVLIK
jgi:hypothetical protein